MGERKACAAIVLAFFGLLFLLNGMLGPSPTAAMFVGLATTYLVGFFGVVSGWFWARWYALGLSSSGLLTAAVVAFQVGPEPVVLVWGGAHGVLGLALLGHGAASAFDGRADWRARFGLDEDGARRLGKAVTRAAASLPYLVMAGLAPKQGTGLLVAMVAAVALLCAAAGVLGLLRLRAWSLLAFLGAAGCLVLVWAPLGPALHLYDARVGACLDLGFALPAAAALLVGAFLPFARSVAVALLRR